MFLTKNVLSQSFSDVSLEAGINHAQITPNLFGGGVAILDYNNDGFEDLFLTGGSKDDRLFKNNGDGTFEDVSLTAGIILTETVKTSGVVSGDINNDGYDDIFVTTESSHRNLLFMNNGNGSFTETSEAAGIKGNVWSTGATMGDYNADGLLDIYVINYIKENKLIRNEGGAVIGFNHDCHNNHFYVNQGDGTFIESAEALNIENTGCGLAVMFTDYNQDNQIDLYVANDFGEWITPNTLYENQFATNSAFEDKSTVSGLDCSIYGMGIAAGDINNDGLFEYFITNLGKNVLYKNNGNSSFEDITLDAQVANEFSGDDYATSWGANFFDYDLDGYLDLFVSNGHMPSADFLKNSEEDPNKLYRNLGDDSFEDLSVQEGVADIGISRGSAVFDYDNDGDLDLIVTNLSRSSNTTVNTLLYNNKQASDYFWIKFKLEGVASNKNAIGARVIIYQNNKSQIRELLGGSSHASNDSKILHFGLANNSTLDSAKIVWPNGEAILLKGLITNQTYHILEGNHEAQIVGCSDLENDYYNPKATYSSGCLQKTELVTSLSFPNDKMQFRVFPNPAHESIRVSFSPEAAGKVFFAIMDTQGRVVFEHTGVKPSVQLHLPKLATGCYWYKAIDANGIIGTGTLAIN